MYQLQSACGDTEYGKKIAITSVIISISATIINESILRSEGFYMDSNEEEPKISSEPETAPSENTEETPVVEETKKESTDIPVDSDSSKSSDSPEIIEPTVKPDVVIPVSSGSNFTEKTVTEEVVPSTTTPASEEEEPNSPNWKLIALVVSVLTLLGIGAFLVAKLSGSDEVIQTQAVKNEIPLLRVGLVNGPLNIIYNDVVNDGAQAVNNQIYEGLVAYENINKIVPRLADSWSNPDSSTWVFKLKQGVTLHSGKTLTAEDVKFTLDNPETVGAGGFGATIASVEVVDAATIKITTDGPDPLLLGRLTGLWIIDADTADQPFPAGTGPYVVKANTPPTEKLIELTAFDGYHGGKVYTRALQFKQLDNADAVTAFNNQEIDIASALFTDSEKLALPNMKTNTINDLGVSFLGTNAIKDSPLENIKVRQAIEKAIDPTLIVAAQEVLGQPVDQFVSKDIPGFNPKISRTSLNVAEAKQLIIDAGFPDGITLTLSYATSSNQGMFESIKTQLAAIGVTVVADFYSSEDVGAFFDKAFSGTAELLFLNYAPDVLDASDSYGVLFGDGGIITSTVNTEVASILGEASKTLNEQERLTKLKSISVVLQEAVVSIPLYSRDAVTGLADNYAATRDFPNGGSGFRYSQVYLP